RKVFELARTLPDPVNLSIGQPDFDVPDPVKAAAHAAIDHGFNAYTLSQGIPELRERLAADVRARLPHPHRALMVTSGTSGARLARERGLLLLSDAVYRAFCYDAPFTPPAEFNDDVLVFDGFSKAYGMTGWRLGYAHGPRRLIEEMTKLQQFTFVCAPSMVQHAGLVAWDTDMSDHVASYRHKRDRIYEGLKDRFEVVKPEGAFYIFPHAPWGTSTEFV